ncbi:MAG: response regulator [Niastella sp.]|jgi:CheY-like chemotaxis protein|uniref:response regulator n=1 Tax=Niastella sp. TaxID=1869183 RepID=UPI003899B00E
MNKDGEIIIIEDDLDDQLLFAEVFKNLKFSNKTIFFSESDKALAYLESSTTIPFLILSDINLPKLNGLELKARVFTNEKLSQKCIPYIFFTTAASKESVVNAYATSAQGFFTKPVKFSELQEIVGLIIEYWKKCYSPGDFNLSN